MDLTTSLGSLRLPNPVLTATTLAEATAHSTAAVTRRQRGRSIVIQPAPSTAR